MTATDNLESSKVCEIFKKMSYGSSVESITDILTWLETRKKNLGYVDKENEQPVGSPVELKNVIDGETICVVFTPEIDAIKTILSKSNDKVKWIDTPAFQRATTLKKLGAEIESNAQRFAQIEAVTRNILTKDTRARTVPLLAEYFYYYSGFSLKLDCAYKPAGISVALISDENSLPNIGLYLAPALAAGYNVVMQVGIKLTPLATLIIELAERVGVPRGVISLIPSDNGELLPYLSCDNVSIVTLLIDLHNEKYRGINNLNKNILALSTYKTPILIFDSADLDSACESVIDAVWGSGGLLLWSADTIIVQENIFSDFLDKLKKKMKSLKIGPANDKLADVSCAGDVSFLIELAEKQGLEIFQTEDSKFSPTFFTGGKIRGEITKTARANFASVLPFRSINEAINLANNTEQGLGATIWSENVGLVSEVAKKLKVSNIWINSNCCMSAADVTFSPIKDSGVGYFGGKEGFYEYVDNRKRKASNQIKTTGVSKRSDSVAKAVVAAKKSQEKWSTLSKMHKAKLFQKFAEYIEDNKKQLSEFSSDQWLASWITMIYECITNTYTSSFATAYSDYSLISTREPRGTVVIEARKDFNSHNIKLILSALFQGNTVLILNENSVQNIYKEFAKCLPNDVLIVASYDVEIVECLAARKDINGYFGSLDDNPVFGFLPVQFSKIFKNVKNSWDDVHRSVTFAKNIWSDIGKSSI